VIKSREMIRERRVACIDKTGNACILVGKPESRTRLGKAKQRQGRLNKTVNFF
jgi:hypothetical protein